MESNINLEQDIQNINPYIQEPSSHQDCLFQSFQILRQGNSFLMRNIETQHNQKKQDSDIMRMIIKEISKNIRNHKNQKKCFHLSKQKRQKRKANYNYRHFLKEEKLIVYKSYLQFGLKKKTNFIKMFLFENVRKPYGLFSYVANKLENQRKRQHIKSWDRNNLPFRSDKLLKFIINQLETENKDDQQSLRLTKKAIQLLERLKMLYEMWEKQINQRIIQILN